MYVLQFCKNFGLSKLEKCFSTFKSDEISRTFVFDTSKFSSIGKSSMIISRLVLLNSVPDTFKLDKFLNLDKETTIVFFFYPYQVFGLIKLLEVELHQYENWTWTFLLCMLFTASEALAQASLDNSENMGNISIAGEN